jgi:hypothetical protein
MAPISRRTAGAEVRHRRRPHRFRPGPRNSILDVAGAWYPDASVEKYHRLAFGMVRKLARQLHFPSDDVGFFQFAPKIISCGRNQLGIAADLAGAETYDVSKVVHRDGPTIRLQYSFAEAIDNLGPEHYAVLHGNHLYMSLPKIPCDRLHLGNMPCALCILAPELANHMFALVPSIPIACLQLVYSLEKPLLQSVRTADEDDKLTLRRSRSESG